VIYSFPLRMVGLIGKDLCLCDVPRGGIGGFAQLRSVEAYISIIQIHMTESHTKGPVIILVSSCMVPPISSVSSLPIQHRSTFFPNA
jgi:hypothetical protein